MKIICWLLVWLARSFCNLNDSGAGLSWLAKMPLPVWLEEPVGMIRQTAKARTLGVRTS